MSLDQSVSKAIQTYQKIFTGRVKTFKGDKVLVSLEGSNVTVSAINTDNLAYKSGETAVVFMAGNTYYIAKNISSFNTQGFINNNGREFVRLGKNNPKKQVIGGGGILKQTINNRVAWVTFVQTFFTLEEYAASEKPPGWFPGQREYRKIAFAKTKYAGFLTYKNTTDKIREIEQKITDVTYTNPINISYKIDTHNFSGAYQRYFLYGGIFHAWTTKTISNVNISGTELSVNNSKTIEVEYIKMFDADTSKDKKLSLTGFFDSSSNSGLDTTSRSIQEESFFTPNYPEQVRFYVLNSDVIGGTPQPSTFDFGKIDVGATSVAYVNNTNNFFSFKFPSLLNMTNNNFHFMARDLTYNKTGRAAIGFITNTAGLPAYEIAVNDIIYNLTEEQQEEILENQYRPAAIKTNGFKVKLYIFTFEILSSEAALQEYFNLNNTEDNTYDCPLRIALLTLNIDRTLTIDKITNDFIKAPKPDINLIINSVLSNSFNKDGDRNIMNLLTIPELSNNQRFVVEEGDFDNDAFDFF